MGRHLHLFRRNAVYYWRRRLPEDFARAARRVDLVLSLRTRDPATAKPLARRLYDHPVVSVEHVLPQTPREGSQWLTDFPAEADRDQWVHKLANLVLLTRRKNAQAGNLDFAEKKAKYFSTKAGVSNFALTSKVLSEASWTLETLKRRQADLVGEIAKLWRLG